MTRLALDALARDLESQGRFAEAELARLRSLSLPLSASPSQESARLSRAAREAELREDWRRWSELLAMVPAAG